MSDEGDGGGGQGLWFRRRRRALGYGYAPANWQGAVATLAFVAILIVTVFAADPNTAKPSSVPLFLKVKSMIGLSASHLPARVMVALILAEVGAFLGLVWLTSRPVRPLD